MIDSPFTQAKPPRLTAYCKQLSAPEVLHAMVNSAVTDGSSGIDKRAVVLFLIIMSAAGNFVEGTQRDEPFYKETRQYLRDTNPDVITAEAIVWITFLIGQLWLGDQKKAREMFERVGYVTVSKAGRLALEMIKSTTSVDFTARAIESRKLYIPSGKEGKLVEAFSSILFRSVGCKSLAEPLKIVAWPPLELAWMHINLAVSVFFSAMPSAYYDTYKNILRERSDLFPYDDDDFDDGGESKVVGVNTVTKPPTPHHDYSKVGKALGEIFIKPDVWRNDSKLHEYQNPEHATKYEIAFARVAIIKDAIRRYQPELVATEMMTGIDQYVAEAFAKEENTEALEYYGNAPLAVVARQAIRLYEENVLPLTQLAAVLARRLSATGLSTLESAALFEEVATEAGRLMKVSSALQKLRIEQQD